MSKKTPALQKSNPNLRRRTFFAPLLMPVLGIAAMLLLLAWLWSSMNTITIVLVRHAEKTSEAGDNPGLSTAGEARAQRLAKMLVKSDVAALYASEFRRTRLTLQPLATALGMQIRVIAADDPERLVDEVLFEHRGRTVVIAGHSNTVPDLIERFTGVEIAPIDEGDYRGIYVLSVPNIGQKRLLRLEFAR